MTKDLTQLGDYTSAPQMMDTQVLEPEPMQEIREFADQLPIGNPQVEAQVPFSIRIHGHLSPEEREKLLDLLSRENMGIREVDLEPQFEAGQLLLPRLSEYAGVMIVQALRGSGAEIYVYPSDEEPSYKNHLASSSHSLSLETLPVAENLPLMTMTTLPQEQPFTVLDVITASAILMTRAVAAERSSEYQEILGSLQREIKYKAFRKGATAVLNFTIQLTQLPNATQYRVTAMGTAVKAAL